MAHTRLVPLLDTRACCTLALLKNAREGASAACMVLQCCFWVKAEGRRERGAIGGPFRW